MGAQQIDLATREGWAEFLWLKSRQFNPEDVREASADANYTLAELEVLVTGRVDGKEFVIDGSSQRVPLSEVSTDAAGGVGAGSERVKLVFTTSDRPMRTARLVRLSE